MGSEDSARWKREAGEYAVEKYVISGMRIGLGTGSTVDYALMAIAGKIRSGALEGCVFLSSSAQTDARAADLGIPVADGAPDGAVDGAYGGADVDAGGVLGLGALDLVIDGADEVNGDKQLIKGGGGALMREKILAYNSRQVVIIVDAGKVVENFAPEGFLLPIEVLPFALGAVRRRVLDMTHARGPGVFGAAQLRRAPDGNLLVTDNGNNIIDARFEIPLTGAGAAVDIERRLDAITGVVCNGLFTFAAGESGGADAGPALSPVIVCSGQDGTREW